jgi:hypoxia up-regulated 1
LSVETYYVGKVQPLSPELIEEYKFNIAELARMDKERVLLEEAKNNVESYMYKIKNKLMDHEDEVAKISTEEQREELLKLASAAEEWLFDEGDTADLETVRAKYEELTAPAEKVWFRLSEMTKRPAAVKELREKLTEIEEKFTKWVTNMTHITEEEKSDVFSKIEDARKWLADKEDEQAGKAGHEDPAFTSEEVPEQTRPIQKLIGKLSKKPKPKPLKNETATNKKNATEDGNESSSEGAEAEKDAESDASDADSSDGGDESTEKDVENDASDADSSDGGDESTEKDDKTGDEEL